MNPRIETKVFSFPQTLLGRLASGLIAIALLVLAFFFLFFFLLLAGVLITGITIRALWRARKLRTQASEDVLEGEYTVEAPETKQLDDAANDTTQKH